MPRSPSPHSRRRRDGDTRDRRRSPPRRRSRSPSRSRDRDRRRDDEGSSSTRRRRRSPSRSSSVSSHHSRQRQRRSASPSRERKESREERKQRKADKRERREKKREKREAKAAKKRSKTTTAAITEYGKYGIISETDMYTKDQEFRAWLIEEKMLNPETLPQNKTKEMFKVFVEDYNTATLPHEKFYALESYERQMNAIKSGELIASSTTYDPRADEAAIANSHKRASKTDGEVYIAREQLEDLRRIERERAEASRMKRMGMEVKESMGVRYQMEE